MAFIGDQSLFIGDDWFIGSWYSAAVATDSDYLGLRSEDVWVYYDEEDNVITELDYGAMLPTNSIGQVIKARYRGFSPIKVLGFFINDIEGAFYNGSASPIIDKETIIAWADQFTGAAVPPGTPGLEIQFDDITSGLPVITQVESGAGDTEYSPIEYTGHENGIVSRDDIIVFTLRLTAPNDANNEVLKAARYHFGVSLSFIEIPENLVDPLVGEVC